MGQSGRLGRCTGPDVPRRVLESSSRVFSWRPWLRATLPAAGEACGVERSRASASVARLCSGLPGLRSALWALGSGLCAPRVRATQPAAAQVRTCSASDPGPVFPGPALCSLRSCESVRPCQPLARRLPRSVLERLRVWRGCVRALRSDPASRCTGPDVLRQSCARVTAEWFSLLGWGGSTAHGYAGARKRASSIFGSRSPAQLSGPDQWSRAAMAARFTAAQVLEQILSSVDQEDYSDCQEEEEEEVSEDEDGEEYNPERREVDDASSPSSPSSEGEQPEEEPPEDEHEDEREDRGEEEISSAPDQREPPLLSKNGKIEWSPVAYGRRSRGALAICQVGPDQTPGPTAYAATQARDIASAFHLFVTPAIERIIVEMTNLHGARKYGDGWRPMDATDLRAYVGLLILAGVYRSRGEAAASLWDAESGRTVFRATMPLKVFHRYSRLLRFDDRQSRPARLATDKLAAIREVWDLWEARLPALYNPGPDVTVDEQLVPFRGRCPFRQYIPSKPAKYGIKSWVACDAKSSYAWKMQVYTGKAAGGGPEKNQGMRVVLDLTTGLSGRNVTCDNFFTSYDLGQRLLERNLTMVGTVRKNKAELPPALLQSRGRQVLSSRFAFTPTATLVSYLAKRNKNVLLLSTLHTEGHVSDRRDRKPALILDYNCNKGGVDNLDKVVGTYSCRRMTARWPLVVFHNILDVSSYNAFVIWREIKPDWMPGKRNKRRVFLEQLGKALVKPLIQRRQHLPRTEAASALVKVLQSATAAEAAAAAAAAEAPRDQQRQGPAADTAAAPLVAPATGASKRKRCQLCPPKKDSKTHTVCCRCKKYICKGCSHAYCHTCAHWAFSQDGTG
ncbi:piggyBac transposable element-derived protein 3-like [Oncorhynchus clarkii lewisi]|uniref:piggyBac transposable element-derived protein 3-like n=1 Tax=Oncorhynchus clarkii lewisi TaxID=490388 RepID=UPI0039B85711